MTVNEFIKEQANERARAAAVLENSLDINGICISAGSGSEGIFVTCGLERLADVMGLPIARDNADVNGRYHQYILINDVRFYGYGYEERKPANDTEVF